MRIEQLEYFIVCSHEKSISQAAQKLHIAQQSLSSSIKALEIEIGYPLFERTNRGSILTDAGHEVYNFAKEVVSKKQMLFEQLFQTHTAQCSGKLRIGHLNSFNEMLLPKMVRDFLGRYPNITIEYQEAELNTIITQLINGEIELGLIHRYCQPDLIYPNLPENIKFVELDKGTPFVWVSSNSCLASQRSVHLSVLAQYPIILTKNVDQGFYERVFGAIAQGKGMNSQLDVRYIFNPQIMAELVEDNQAVCLAVQYHYHDLEWHYLFKDKQVVAIPINSRDAYMLSTGYMYDACREEEALIKLAIHYFDGYMEGERL